VPPSDPAPVHQANQTTVYNGVYKLRTVEESDLYEVLLYWSRLVTAAVSLVAVASAVFLLEGNDAVRQGIDLLYAASAAGMVLSTCHCSSSTSTSCNPNQALPQASLWAVGMLGFLVTYLVAAAGRGLIDEDEGRCCTACEVIVRQSKPCGGSLAESAEKVKGEVAWVRLPSTAGLGFAMSMG
jgi:hypothetical protein